MNRKAIAKKMLFFPKEQIVKEHVKLVKDLKSDKKSAIKQELKKQSKELSEYKKE